MDKESFQQKVGIDQAGITRGSRFLPFLLLIIVVVAFVAHAIKLPTPDLQLVSGREKLPASGKNLFVVGREQADENGPLRFEIFDAAGKRRTVYEREEDILSNAAAPEKIASALTDLKVKLKDYWAAGHVPEDDRDEILGDIASITDYQWTAGEFSAVLFNSIANIIANDFSLLLLAQLKLIVVLCLFSILPGLFGMIYRRAFWAWFGAAFAILYGINWIFDAGGSGLISVHVKDKLQQTWTESLLLITEMLVVVLVLVCRLRRHSTEVTDAPTKLINIVMSVTLILLAVAWFYGMYNWFGFSWWQGFLVSILLLVGSTTLYQSFTSAADCSVRGKNILVCLDGTWNQPGTRDFGYLAETNVFKLFRMAKGEQASKRYNANRCKEYLDDNQCARQIAFYYHGVGNKAENSQLGQIFGGVFGMGATAIVERAYLDVVRVYRPGDRIYITGFSRGAAIARLLAGVIGYRGAPTSMWTLRLFGRHWPVWKSSRKIENVPVDVLGCWDTVGAFGISKNILGIPFQRINLLKDLSVSLCVKRAYHMVALDEERDSFEPTLMDPDPTTPNRIVEVWFSGNHSNIGGGYATDRLSNLTLDFLLSHISSSYSRSAAAEPGKDESWGIYVNAMRKPETNRADEGPATVIDPNPRGRIRHSTGAIYRYAPRTLPIHAVIHDSVFERMKDVLPVYAPQSLFNLNEGLVRKRAAIDEEVGRLVDTRSLSKEECEKIRNWSNEKLSLTKWSEYLNLELDDKSLMKDHLKPAEELSND